MQLVWRRFGFRNLLFWLFVYIVVNPFLSSVPHSRIIFQLLMTLVFFFAIFALHRERNIFALSLFLLGLALVFHWVGIFGVVRYSGLVSQLITILYLAVLVYSFFLAIFSAKTVSFEVISATLCLYLIMGLLWAHVFVVLETLCPGSFSGKLLDPGNPAWEQLQGFIYFSFITLTTLGYGDITPQTQGAGALCQAEAIVGQIYMAVLVAWLVSMYSSDKKRREGTG
jgi:voltage-gated potassium channel